MSSESLQPGDAQTLKSVGLVVGGLILVMVICISIALTI